MDEILKQYIVLYKEMSNVINGPDYPGKEKDIQHQKDQIEVYEKHCGKDFLQIMTMMCLLTRLSNAHMAI